MSANTTKRVRTNQSRENLYKISFHNSKFHVYKVGPWGGLTEIGTSRALDDALAIIRSYSASDIRSIDDW
ncbi:MAG: hypothetical protein IPJ13_26370 [Saprospiraceae bacterium]|nr:hypothetical protein [Saprospiraceae bacterium]